MTSADAIAVPLINLLGLFERGGSRYPDVKVTLTEGEEVTAAWSCRCGSLRLRRAGESVAVMMPIEYADGLVFKHR